MPSNRRLLSFIKRRASALLAPHAFHYAVNALGHYRAARRHAARIPYPTSVMLELTSRCNLRCIICAREYEHGKAMEHGDMDIGKAKTFFSRYNRYFSRLCLSGNGETLLYPHLAEFLEYCRSINRSIILFMSSNLAHKDAPRIFSRIQKHLDTFQVSIDGTGAVYESIRKGGDYGRFLTNLEQVCSAAGRRRAMIKLNMVVFGKNFQEMKAVVELAKRFSISEIYLAKLNPVAIDRSHFDARLYQSNEFRQALAGAAHCARKQGITLRYPKSLLEKDDTICGYPWNSIFINWQGYIAPCCAMPFPKLMASGNVFESDLLTCLNSKAFQEFRLGFSRQGRPPLCAGCE